MSNFESDYYHYYLKDIYSEEEVLERYKKHLLSIDDMLEVCEQRNKGHHNYNYDVKMQTDENSGKLYIDHNFINCKDLLKNHLVAEMLWAKKDEVDWERVSCHYDYEMVEKIKDILVAPLVWVPSEEAGEYCVVKGMVAKEVYPVDKFDNLDRYKLYHELQQKGLLWFADHLPEYSKELHQYRYGHHFPPGILLWDRFFQGQFGHIYYHDIREQFENVAKECGSAKAAELFRRLRKDWPHIKRDQLFGMSDLDDLWMGTVSKIEEGINGEMELYLQKWEAEAEKEAIQSSTRGPKERSLFKDKETELREKKRFVTFINNHKMQGEDVDTSQDNRVNQVAVCFFRIWKKKEYLMAKASGTALARFIREQGLSITVNEKAHGNALNRMIHSDDVFPMYAEEVRASFYN